MDDLSVEKIDEGSGGSVKIANDVVATIAGLAASEVPGVAGMSGGVVGGIAELLGRKNLTKGIKVETIEQEANLEIYVVAEYGTKIHEVAQRIQENVKSAIESMTGLKVASVNVSVQGINFKSADEEPETDEE